MGIRDRFAESYARSKTMTGAEKKANDIIGKLILKKAIIPIVIIAAVVIAGNLLKINNWILLGINLLIAVGTFFYIKQVSKKYQTFVPYVGNLISIEKVGKKSYKALLKQGKKPIRLDIDYGGEDLERVKKNQLVQISYNAEAKIAILIKR